MTTYSKILVAVDLTPEAKEVAARARDLGKRYNAALYLIHVVEPNVTAGAYELIPEFPVDSEEILVQRAGGYLKALADDMQLADARQSIEIGSVKREILRFAREEGCDLIVIGTHGRHGVATLLGSTANAVLHGTHCDVLCVRVGG